MSRSGEAEVSQVADSAWRARKKAPAIGLASALRLVVNVTRVRSMQPARQGVSHMQQRCVKLATSHPLRRWHAVARV
jgi:hypothetical protein